jgi:nucleoside-diphosphate-sugar epimerase
MMANDLLGIYPIFDIASQTESMQAIFNAFASAIGFKGKVELTGSSDTFGEAMSTTGNNSAGRAKSLLGWHPRRTGLVQGMNSYAKAFVAHQ